jgi:hypothetical protein
MRTLVYNSTRVCNKTTMIQNESTDSCKHIYSLKILAIDKASVAFHQVCPLRESNREGRSGSGSSAPARKEKRVRKLNPPPVTFVIFQSDGLTRLFSVSLSNYVARATCSPSLGLSPPDNDDRKCHDVDPDVVRPFQLYEPEDVHPRYNYC